MGGFRDEAPQNSTMARLINPAQRSMIKAQRAERWATAGDRWGNGLRVSGVHGPAVSKPRPALNPISCWPVGLMDKASASGAGDSRFESWAGHPTLRTPGVEPGSQAWEACMMPLHYVRLCQTLRCKSLPQGCLGPLSGALYPGSISGTHAQTHARSPHGKPWGSANV